MNPFIETMPRRTVFCLIAVIVCAAACGGGGAPSGDSVTSSPGAAPQLLLPGGVSEPALRLLSQNPTALRREGALINEDVLSALPRSTADLASREPIIGVRLFDDVAI